MKTKLLISAAILVIGLGTASAIDYFSSRGEATVFGTSTNIAVVNPGGGQAVIDAAAFTTRTNGTDLLFYDCIGASAIAGTNAIGTNLVVGTTNAAWQISNTPGLIWDNSQKTWLRVVLGSTMTNHATSARAQINVNTNGCINYLLGTNLNTGSWIYVMRLKSGIRLRTVDSMPTLGAGWLTCNETNALGGLVGARLAKDNLFVGGRSPTNVVMLQLGVLAPIAGSSLPESTNFIHYVGGRILTQTPY